MLTADLGDAVVDLTRQLVALDLVNPGLVPAAAGEGPIAQFVADRLSNSGFEVQLVPALSDPRRMSVIAVRDCDRPGRTVLAQHERYPMAVADAVGRFLAGGAS